MEFYLHSKDDRKSSTLVNLATTFKIDDVNYIVYYNTQVEKSVIDIYIGKISYGDQCLVVNKIDSEKQNTFLDVIKGILSNNNPVTEISDYSNIIDTATIVLDSVQKISIPTSSLENLKKYHRNEEIEDTNEETPKENEEISFDFDNKIEQNLNKDNNIETKDSSKDEEEVDEDIDPTESFIHSDDKLSSLDNLLNNKEKESKPKKKLISTPVLTMLILAVILCIVLYLVGNNLS